MNDNELRSETFSNMIRVLEKAQELECSLHMGSYYLRNYYAEDPPVLGENMESLHTCGTAACVAGWCASDPYFQEKFLNSGYLKGKDIDLEDIASNMFSNIGGKLLGLDAHELEFLFGGDLMGRHYAATMLDFPLEDLTNHKHLQSYNSSLQGAIEAVKYLRDRK